MGFNWMAILAVCLGLMMDEYMYQVPSAVSGQLRNSTACQDVFATILKESSLSAPVELKSETTETCLHLDPVEYNLLYAVSALGTALTAPFYQLFLRRFGTGTMSMFSYSFSFLAMVIFALGSLLEIEQAITVMLIARLIQGMTRGFNLTAARRIIAKSSYNFEDSSYITGLVLSVHLGGALNFWITGWLAVTTGLQGTLWITVAIAGISLIPAICLSVAFRRSEKKEQVVALLGTEIIEDSLNWYKALNKKVIPATFWWICAAAVFFLSTLNVFISNAPQMIQDMGYSEIQGYYAVGLIYFTCLLLPILAFMVDYWDRKDLWLATTMAVLLIGFALEFIVGSISLLCFCMGIAFSLHAILLPACVARIVPQTSFKVAMDASMLLSSLGIALFTLGAGGILKLFTGRLRDAWVNFLIVEAVLAAVAMFMVLFALIYDHARGNAMQHSRNPDQPSTPLVQGSVSGNTKTKATNQTDKSPVTIQSQGKSVAPRLVNMNSLPSDGGEKAAESQNILCNGSTADRTTYSTL